VTTRGNSPAKANASWVKGLIRSSVRTGFGTAYRQIQLDPDKYLIHVRRVYQLPIETWKDVHHLNESVITLPANRIIRASAKAAALEGMGLGIGGISTILPDMGILSAITIRMLQKLSLIHGFEYSTEEEVVALWVAAASAAGLDLTREILGKQVVERLVPRVIDQIAVKVGTEVAEKWVGRLIPIIGAGTASALNYYFVRGWGRRAQAHFLSKRKSVRDLEPSPRSLLPAAGRAV
jgi:EcsC protein family